MYSFDTTIVGGNWTLIGGSEQPRGQSANWPNARKSPACWSIGGTFFMFSGKNGDTAISEQSKSNRAELLTKWAYFQPSVVPPPPFLSSTFLLFQIYSLPFRKLTMCTDLSSLLTKLNYKDQITRCS